MNAKVSDRSREVGGTDGEARCGSNCRVLQPHRKAKERKKHGRRWVSSGPIPKLTENAEVSGRSGHQQDEGHKDQRSGPLRALTPVGSGLNPYNREDRTSQIAQDDHGVFKG